MLKQLWTARDMSVDEWTAAQAEWRNPANWRYGIYYAPRDPHVWVRKQRVEVGWTLNMAHGLAWLLAAAILAAPFAIILLRHAIG